MKLRLDLTGMFFFLSSSGLKNLMRQSCHSTLLDDLGYEVIITNSTLRVSVQVVVHDRLTNPTWADGIMHDLWP